MSRTTSWSATQLVYFLAISFFLCLSIASPLSKQSIVVSRNEVAEIFPRDGKLFSNSEQELLREAAEEINSYVTEKDLVMFVGNSGSYFGWVFDRKHPGYNMKTLPISGTKKYKQDAENTPNQKQLEQYFDMYIEPLLRNEDGTPKEIGSIIIVDHSAKGLSVNGFREAFLDIVEAGAAKMKGKKHGAKVRQELAAKEDFFRLINVIDQQRDPARGATKDPVMDPSHEIEVIAKFSVGGPNEVNRLVGDEHVHPRVQPEYPVARWGSKTGQAWSGGKFGVDKPGTTEEQGKAMQKSIVDWNKKNGGLLVPCWEEPAAAGPSDSKDKGKGKAKKCKRKPGKKTMKLLQYLLTR